LNGLSNQLLGQVGTLAWRNQPAHHEERRERSLEEKAASKAALF